MRINKRKKLVFGVGVNDADYNVCETIMLNGKQKIIWTCPFYVKWTGMLGRCYDIKRKSKYQTYVGCEAVPQWFLFSNFKSWMQTQNWEGKDLDKDILFPGNKVYGPDTCVFVDSKVNTFLIEAGAMRGEWPIGVTFHKQRQKFMASCRSVETAKQQHLGLFKTAEEAHSAWLEFKLQQAYILAAQQDDSRVAKALIDRYEQYRQEN